MYTIRQPAAHLQATFSRFRNKSRGHVLVTLFPTEDEEGNDAKAARARAWPFTTRAFLIEVLSDQCLQLEFIIDWVLEYVGQVPEADEEESDDDMRVGLLFERARPYTLQRTFPYTLQRTFPLCES